MDQQEWDKRWNDRTNRYAQRVLSSERTVAITADPSRLARYDTQTALLSAANLLGRMTPNVKLAFPDAPLHPKLPWRGSLHEFILPGMKRAYPHGRFVADELSADDFQFHCGRAGEYAIDGSGWNAYCGPGPSPLPDEMDGNPFGACLAVAIAAAHLFRTPFAPFEKAFVCNALDWTEAAAPQSPPIPDVDLGAIFFVGAGSVGTAALYYLTLATRRFAPSLFDMDHVKIHNVSRSPIFTAEDCGPDDESGVEKVVAARRFLEAAEIEVADVEPRALHESKFWTARQQGTPDLIVSAANEHDVRYHIEMGYPPLQVYATTGRNWQVALLRHEPGAPSCSMCRFPPEETKVPMACATDHRVDPSTEKSIDAALPFLSFAAGLMTAADIVKLSMPGRGRSLSQVTLNLRADPCFIRSPLLHRTGCTCEHRDNGIHRAMVEGSRYAFVDKAP